MTVKYCVKCRHHEFGMCDKCAADLLEELNNAPELPVKLTELELLKIEHQKLVAENCIQDFIITAVKDLVSESEGVVGWHRNGDVATWDEVLPELSHSETPATDAAIAEIMARGIEVYKAKCLQSIERTKLTLKPEQRELAEQMLLGIIDGCDVVAKELRDGTLPEKFAANLRAGRKG